MTGAYNQIKEEVEAILVHSQDFPFDVDATKMMEQWEKAKAPFIKFCLLYTSDAADEL